MPKTRFDKTARDPLKEMVLGRKRTMRLSEAALAEKTGVSLGRYRTMMSGPSDAWRISEAVALTRALEIPIAEMRELIAR